MPPSDGLCAYCKTQRGHQADHIMPKALRQRYAGWEDVTVPACHQCNVGGKGTRRIVPVGYPRLAELRELTGLAWKEWNGDPAAIRQVIR